MAGRVYRGIQPVAGDRALAAEDANIPVVEAILPRESVLQRTVPLGRSTQIIASNVDIVLAICSLHQPDFSHGFLCRALVAARWRKLRAVVVLNKMDLCLSGEDRTLLAGILSVYEGAGYTVFQTSTSTGRGTGELMKHIRGSTVVMAGPSGAGKTSLAKRYIPALDVRIGSVNPKTSKGRHTTVTARMIPLGSETFLIDTPGLKMFSIEHVPREELQFCFPEFDEYLGRCRFRDCLHISEPGCGVKGAVELGSISGIRYGMYEAFMREAEGQQGNYLSAPSER
ncbi:MAG: ribosome small subunit-dependent GTPase A [Candidatus Fermentibacteraceae bacterium]|nr:ribosome small subunit-dependent GTPase A [Candidatus Fermentibacteraceae bacterium]